MALPSASRRLVADALEDWHALTPRWKAAVVVVAVPLYAAYGYLIVHVCDWLAALAFGV